jgi:hypothetical protein
VTRADLHRLIQRCEANPSGPVTMSVQDMASLARLALAAHGAQSVEHAENCPIRVTPRNNCECGLHKLDGALRAVFEEDES